MARAETKKRGILSRWAFVLGTCNLPPGKTDVVTKVLVLIRACVLPMTLTSGLIAGLLAFRHPGFEPGLYLISAAGLLVAHGANNLMNDLFDLRTAVDTAKYPRALYAPHPVLSGMVTQRGLWTLAAAFNLVSLGVLVVLYLARGWIVVAFALAGFFVSAGYTAPPIRLKKRGLGEPGVLIVWGPLMVGGTYYAATGTVTWEIIAGSLPYALLATAVLMGKHIDKLDWDRRAEIGTLPALLGPAKARVLTQGLMALFYASLIVLVATKVFPVAALLALLALPRLAKVWTVFSNVRPDDPPPGYPVWPLWYAPSAFLHTRRAGALFVLGLVAGGLIPGPV